MALVLVSLVPFLNKAVHMDDPLFIYSARQILRNPFDFYGFDVNWYGFEEPMHEVNQNPPLAAYFLALIGYLAGFDEWAMHAGFILPALGTVLGTYALARRCCRRPVLAAALVFAMPVTLVSSTTLMCDMLLLCFWCWAVAFWIDAERRNRPAEFVLAGACMGAAALSKYYGICLVPMLAAYSIARRLPLWTTTDSPTRRDWPIAITIVVALAIPCAALIAFENWSYRLYGHGLTGDALTYASATRGVLGVAWHRKFMYGLTFLGGGILPLLYFVPHFWGRWGTTVVLAVFVLLALTTAWAGTYLGYTPPAERGWTWLMPLEAAAFVTAGLCVVALGVLDLARRRDPEAVLLVFWIAGTFYFATYLNWSVTSRTILPLVPAVAVLVVRAIDRPLYAWEFLRSRFSLLPALALGLALALAVAFADRSRANAARQAAALIPEYLFDSYQVDPAALWFQGHWGFQYYMEQQGARCLDITQGALYPNDFVIVPMCQTNVQGLPHEAADLEPVMGFHVLQGVTTASVAAGAQFYLGQMGFPFPYAFGPNSPEFYYVFHVTRTIEMHSKRPNRFPSQRSPSSLGETSD